MKPLYLLAALAPLPAAAQNDEAALRHVADGVLQQTTRRLIDRSTGTIYENSDDLAPKPEISIESKFNAWFYQTWLLADGMKRTTTALGEEKYRDYGEANLDFIFHHMAYFQRRHDAKMKAAPVGDGALSPTGFYFGLGALWQTGLAPLVAATKDARYEPFLKRLNAFLATNPRFDDGAFYRKGKGMMTDGDIMDVCGSTDTGDLNFYLNRPRLKGDLHGFGSFLLAGAEIVRMQKVEQK